MSYVNKLFVASRHVSKTHKALARQFEIEALDADLFEHDESEALEMREALQERRLDFLFE